MLGEPTGTAVRKQLAKADRVVSSTLTAMECHRAITRGASSGRLKETQALAALRLLGQAADSWTTVEMTGTILERARQSFPNEPVRTLDAIHLATAMHFREAIPELVVVSLDDHVRDNARALDMLVAPRR